MAPILLAFLLTAFIGSSNPIFFRLSANEIPPITYTALRFLLATIIFFPFWYRKKQTIPVKDWYKLLPYVLNIVFYALGIQYTSVTMAGLLYTLAPVITAFLGYYFLKEKVSKENIIGFSLAIVGLYILLEGSIRTSDIFSLGTPLGNALILFAIFAWALYLVCTKSLGKKYSDSTLLFYSSLVTTVVLLFLLPLEWRIRPFIVSDISYNTALYILATGSIGTVFFYFCYQWLIRNSTVFLASLALYANFVVVSLYGAFFLNEHFTERLLLGSLFIILGVFIATTFTKIKKIQNPMLQ